MTYYWRLKNIAEQRDMPTKRLRQWWREAVTSSRSERDRWILASLVGAAAFAAALLADNLHGGALMRYALVPVFAAAFCAAAGVIYEARCQQPRARAWLQANRPPAGEGAKARPGVMPS